VEIKVDPVREGGAEFMIEGVTLFAGNCKLDYKNYRTQGEKCDISNGDQHIFSDSTS
jgi:hypothetical protein